MVYQVKVNGTTVAGAWSKHAARRKALAIAFGQVALRTAERRQVEVWKGVLQVGAFSPAHQAEDDHGE